MLSGTFLTHRWWAVVATFGVIFAAIYLLWAYQQSFHGKPDRATPDPGPGWRERAVIAPLIILIVFLGVYPKPVLDRITPSVNQLIAHVEAATGSTSPRWPAWASRRRRRPEAPSGRPPRPRAVTAAGRGGHPRPKIALPVHPAGHRHAGRGGAPAGGVLAGPPAAAAARWPPP